MQGLFQGGLVKANNELAVNVNYGHTHLPRFFDHFARLFLVFGHVIIRERDLVFGEKLLGQTAKMAGRRGINNHVHCVYPPWTKQQKALAVAAAALPFHAGTAVARFFLHLFAGFFRGFSFGFLFQKDSPERITPTALKKLFQKDSKRVEFSSGRFKKPAMYCIYDMNSFGKVEFGGVVL